MPEYAIFDYHDGVQIREMLNWWRGRRNRRTAFTGEDMYARLMKITGCANATGYANAQFCTGDPSAPVVDTSTTVKLFIGKTPWWQTGDYVFAIPVAMPSIHWVVVCGLIDPLRRFVAPTPEELAAEQDDPAASSHCADTVNIP